MSEINNTFIQSAEDLDIHREVWDIIIRKKSMMMLMKIMLIILEFIVARSLEVVRHLLSVSQKQMEQQSIRLKS